MNSTRHSGDLNSTARPGQVVHAGPYPLAVVRHLPQLLLDAVALAGLGAVVFGVAQIYQPAAWILGGLLASVGAAALSIARGRVPPSHRGSR